MVHEKSDISVQTKIYSEEFNYKKSMINIPQCDLKSKQVSSSSVPYYKNQSLLLSIQDHYHREFLLKNKGIPHSIKPQLLHTLFRTL